MIARIEDTKGPDSPKPEVPEKKPETPQITTQTNKLGRVQKIWIGAAMAASSALTVFPGISSAYKPGNTVAGAMTGWVGSGAAAAGVVAALAAAGLNIQRNKRGLIYRGRDTTIEFLSPKNIKEICLDDVGSRIKITLTDPSKTMGVANKIVVRATDWRSRTIPDVSDKTSINGDTKNGVITVQLAWDPADKRWGSSPPQDVMNQLAHNGNISSEQAGAINALLDEMLYQKFHNQPSGRGRQ